MRAMILMALLLAASTSVDRLHALFDSEWKWRMRNFPESATAAGVHDYDGRLSDLSPETLARQDKETRAFLGELDAIGAVAEEEQANAAIFREQLEDRVASYKFGEQVLPINADSGFHSDFALIWKSMPLRTVKDYDNYLSRLRAFPKLLDQNIAWMREGLKRGVTVPKATLAGTDVAARTLVAEPEKSALWKAFGELPPQLPPQ